MVVEAEALGRGQGTQLCGEVVAGNVDTGPTCHALHVVVVRGVGALAVPGVAGVGGALDNAGVEQAREFTVDGGESYGVTKFV